MPARPAIDRTVVEHVAELACLSLSDAEIDDLARDLEAILRYVEELGALDTADVPPTSHVGLGAAAWRADEVRPGVTHDEALSQAPRTAQGGFAVPSFVDHE